MELINISINQEEILHHLIQPTDDCITHSIAVPDMPELKWYRICSLGFGFEKDNGSTTAESETELLDYAASLFATSNQPFSLLCERKDGEITYAIGCTEESFAPRLLKSAFGTVIFFDSTQSVSNSTV